MYQMGVYKEVVHGKRGNLFLCQFSNSELLTKKLARHHNYVLNTMMLLMQIKSHIWSSLEMLKYVFLDRFPAFYSGLCNSQPVQQRCGLSSTGVCIKCGPAGGL